VEQLVFIEPSPTSYAQGTLLEDEATLNGLFAANLARTTGLPLELQAHVQPADASALLHYLWEEGRRVGAFGPEVGLAQLQRLQRVFTGCVRALYQHTLSPLPLPLTMLRGQEAQVGDPDAPDRGWAALAAHVDMLEVPGDHYSALRAPHVETLTRTLARVLESPPRRLQAVDGKAG
jgi:thioesterase domain-containing protein